MGALTRPREKKIAILSIDIEGKVNNILSYLLVKTLSTLFPLAKAMPATETVISPDRTSKSSTKDRSELRLMGDARC